MLQRVNVAQIAVFESGVSPSHKRFPADGHGIGYITLECFIAVDSVLPGNKTQISIDLAFDFR